MTVSLHPACLSHNDARGAPTPKLNAQAALARQITSRARPGAVVNVRMTVLIEKGRKLDAGRQTNNPRRETLQRFRPAGCPDMRVLAGFSRLRAAYAA